MKKILKISLPIILILILMVFLANVLLNNMFFNPYKDYENSSRVFYLSVQTLMPNYSFAYISSYEPGTPHRFSHFSQSLFIYQLSAIVDLNNNEKVQGSMRYSFGRAKYVENKAPSSKNVFSQKDFSANNAIKTAVVDEDRYYIAHIAFMRTLLTEEVMMRFQAKLEDKGEILRVIIKTSEDEEAVALGMDGLSSFFIFGQGGYTTSITPQQMELTFKDNLRFLSDNEEVFKLYLASGLFGDSEVSIKERISYIDKFGFENIGVVLLIKSEVLRELLENPEYLLSYLKEDN